MAARANIPILPLFEGRIGKLREMRFWSKVTIGAPDECWLWRESRRKKGYGSFKVASYTTLISSRAAWVLANRLEPVGLVIRHSCDNPPCCNPAHLLAGTIADNNADKLERGRCVGRPMMGELNTRARLTEKDVGAIVGEFNAGRGNTQISARFPVGQALISRIRTGRSWQREAARAGWQPAIRWLETQGARCPEIEAEIARLANDGGEHD